MSKSKCICEPTYTQAGTVGTWKFIYIPAATLPKGTLFRFDLGSCGKPLDWQIPQTNPKEKSNLIWGVLPNGKTVNAVEVIESQENPIPAFEFQLPLELKTNEQFIICIGTPDKENEKKYGNTCKKTIQRRLPFYLNVDPKGKRDYKEQEIFHMDIRGGKLKRLRVVSPSLVARNKPFDVIVRFEDEFGNLTSNHEEGTLIELNHELLRENLTWKLKVPETGFTPIPRLYLNEPGVYKITLRNLKSGEVFQSPPIKCLPDSPLSLFWGLLHGESERFDSGDQIELWLRHMRDDRGLQFVATSCFNSEEETSNETWKNIQTHVAEFNEDDRFVAMLGFHWQGETNDEGLRHFIYSKDLKPILRRKDANNSLAKIYKLNNPKETIAIPSFSMGKTTCYDFAKFNTEYEKVAEIYNAWGSSECTAKEKNTRPISGSGKNSIAETAEGSLIKALNSGCRFGFVAGGLDDRGCYENLFDANQTQYTPGLTAILAKEHNRDSLIKALQDRSCYATTGERIILGFHVVGAGMGSEIDTKSCPVLDFNRYITGYCIGTAPLTEVAIIRNGKVLHRIEAKSEKVEFEWDDKEYLKDILLVPKGDRVPFVYYYLRVTQEDGHIAWSSPIWIDQTAKPASALIKPKKK